MATYTITINERTKAGKSLVEYLRNLGVIEEVPNAETLNAIKDIDNNCGIRCDTFEDYLKAIKFKQ
ncbi:MAG: hypothetical protein IKI67_05235 [Bacteroidales bacterium]|nr:hypothetical protein [Bacteroidales bacterium]